MWSTVSNYCAAVRSLPTGFEKDIVQTGIQTKIGVFILRKGAV